MNRSLWVPALAALAFAVQLGAAGGPAVAEHPARAVRIAQDAEISFWESIKDSKNAAEFKAYLDTYPNGKFAALAKVRMQALQGQGGATPAAPPAKPATAPAAGKAVAGKTYTTSRQATVRQQPNADAAVVTNIAQGAQVTVTADSGNDWYQITSGGNVAGFMHGSQLQGIAVAGGGPVTTAVTAPAAVPALPGGAQPPAAPAPTPAAATPPAQPERLFQASRQHVRVYPQPTARSAYMRDEYYVEDQVIKVVGEVPTKRGQSWLKVLTPSGKTGYVFSGEVRPQGQSKTAKPIKTPEVDD